MRECVATGLFTDPDGIKYVVVLTAHDDVTGLARIDVLWTYPDGSPYTYNAAFNPSPPLAYNPPHRNPVSITFQRISQTQRAQAGLTLTDGAGVASAGCDPVLVTLEPGDDGTHMETVSRLVRTASKISVLNGALGVSTLVVDVNGTVFVAANLHSNERRTIDVSAAMHPGPDNTVQLTAHGPIGSEVDVAITE